MVKSKFSTCEFLEGQVNRSQLLMKQTSGYCWGLVATLGSNTLGQGNGIHYFIKLTTGYYW